MTEKQNRKNGSSNWNSSINRRKILAGVGTTTVGTLAGCLGGGDDDGGDTGNGGNGDGSNGDDGGSNGDSQDGSPDYDFEGESIDAMINLGSIKTAHEEYIIPQMEEKYNLNVNVQPAVTTEQMTQIQANPENPPDIIVPDVIGLHRANENDWLEPIDNHLDIVTNYENIYDKFKYFGNTGVSWMIGEVTPLINTNRWDETPTSWMDTMTQGEDIAIVPYSWSGGPYLVLMASAIATGEDFTSGSLDVEAGFELLQNELAPNVVTTFGGVAPAKQQIASGNWDTIVPFWSYFTYDMFQQNQPIEVIRQPDPTGIAFGQAVAVPNGSSKKEAAMLYVNECLSVRFQEAMSEMLGEGVTNENAEISDEVREYGAPTPDEFDDLAYPNFDYVWENRDDWGQQWDQIFSQ
jgi:ABC-type Fe3+ transport system substrate-binding protein